MDGWMSGWMHGWIDGSMDYGGIDSSISIWNEGTTELRNGQLFSSKRSWRNLFVMSCAVERCPSMCFEVL